MRRAQLSPRLGCSSEATRPILAMRAMAAASPHRMLCNAGVAAAIAGNSNGRLSGGAPSLRGGGGGRHGGHCGQEMMASVALNLLFRNGHLRGGPRGYIGSFGATRGAGRDGTRAFATAEEETLNSSYRWPNSTGPRICILGGGFGGLYTALRLESLTWTPEKRPQVLLVDQSDRFVFKPMLYEILSREVDQWEIAPTYSELLSNTSIMFVKDSVKAVSPCDSRAGRRSPASNGAGGTVYLDGGAHIDYDWLVLALGAESRLNLISGATEYALPFGTLEDALEVDRKLVSLERERLGQEGFPIEVVIVGSGYTGIELAATLAERLGKKGNVQVVDPSPAICASAPAGNREVASRVLSSRGVKLDLGYFVTSINESSVGEIGSEGNGSVSVNSAPRKLLVDLELASQLQTARRKGGRQLTADLILWTVGNKATVPPRPHAENVALPVNGRGQADTDETLRVKGHPRIFAIGDAAGAKDSSGKLLPTTAQVAFQQADYAGWNLWAAINDRPLLPFRYQHLGEMMTLGTSDAAVTLGFIDVTLDGFLGHSVRKLAYLYRLPKDDHRAKVALSWLAKSTVSTISFIQKELTKVLDSR